MIEITPAALMALLEGDVSNFMAAATPGGIEAQEARGQQEMIRKCLLPKRGRGLGEHGNGEWEWRLLAVMGVVRLGEYDDLFYEVRLPDGWKVAATEHHMWSDLLDENGIKVASVFYKAAFYDKRAKIHLEG